MVRREIRLVGSFGARTRADMPRIVALAAAGEVDLETLISERVALADVDRAYQALDRGDVLGRALVTPWEDP
jgi:S-(hydroxymethyl)glutathione dehydrogenase/alcohol dehydrogenase